jgi:hypothetical protein
MPDTCNKRSNAGIYPGYERHLLRRTLKMQHRTAGAMVLDEAERWWRDAGDASAFGGSDLQGGSAAWEGCRVVRRASLYVVAVATRGRARRRRGLSGTVATGRTAEATQPQRRRLAEWLSQDPTEHGWPTSLWTGQRVAELIRQHFGVRYHPGYVRRLLHSMGF